MSEDRGRDSDQSSYQQSDEKETESDSDAGPDFVGECSVQCYVFTQLHLPLLPLPPPPPPPPPPLHSTRYKETQRRSSVYSLK